MIQAVETAPPSVSTVKLCRALNVARSTVYRHRQRRQRPCDLLPAPARSHRALSHGERKNALEALHSPRFADKTPYAVFATLLDEGTYLCSIRTLYRLLEANGEVRERRNQLRHPQYTKPQLLATKPNEVWSWDITKLLGPKKWTYFYLYVILDIFSRYVVGWMLAYRESKHLAKRLIKETVTAEDVVKGQLTVHADNGSSMKSKPVALLLSDLGVTKTHSRPHTSNDNPFSESQFKTMKYCPTFPSRFGSIQDARAFCQDFFLWYNTEHCHTGLALLTPETVHRERGEQVLAQRDQALETAWRLHPERFPRGKPTAPRPPEEVWINPPETERAQNNMHTNFQGEVSHSG